MMGAQRLFAVPSTINRHFAISRKLTDGAITARITRTFSAFYGKTRSRA
jgi:hypothetical protein